MIHNGLHLAIRTLKYFSLGISSKANTILPVASTTSPVMSSTLEMTFSVALSTYAPALILMAVRRGTSSPSTYTSTSSIAELRLVTAEVNPALVMLFSSFRFLGILVVMLEYPLLNLPPELTTGTASKVFFSGLNVVSRLLSSSSKTVFPLRSRIAPLISEYFSITFLVALSKYSLAAILAAVSLGVFSLPT